jgi:hypothetical protein
LKEIPVDAVPTEGPDHVIRMEVSDIPAFVAEDFMPPENELKSRVDFVYYGGLSESNPDRFWKSTGKAWNDGLEFFLRKHKAVADAADKIVSPNDPPEESCERYMRECRGCETLLTSWEKQRKKRSGIKRSKPRPWMIFGSTVTVTP